MKTYTTTNSELNRRANICRLAWALKRETPTLSKSEAFKLAHQAIALQKSMKGGICEFTYVKKDGTIRTAHGTLSSEILGESDYKPEPNAEVSVNQKYFDTDKGAWRCFKRANLIKVA